MSNILDLRLNDVVEILLTRDISYEDLIIDFIDTIPPADIRIVLTGWNNSPTTTFTVGSGLTIAGFKVYWNLGLVNPPENRVSGLIDTIDKTFGEAVNIKLKLVISS